MNQEIKVLSIIGLITLFLIGGAVFLLNKQHPANAEPVDKSILVRDFNHKIESPTAKITIVEFADFQCPACAAAFPAIQKIKQDYKGQINFVYRHFPLMQHPYGKLSARVAEAAGEQGKFWEMYEELYSTQSDWGEGGNPQEKFERYAAELGLNVEKFKTDMNDPRIEQRIADDVSDAQKLNVNSTPTFFLDGEKISGNFNELRAKIDAKIK